MVWEACGASPWAVLWCTDGLDISRKVENHCRREIHESDIQHIVHQLSKERFFAVSEKLSVVNALL
jgi:hypothetical protein